MSEEADRDMGLVRKHMEALSEHFETVQIFVTRHEPATENGTIGVNMGLGNWYARYGQVRESLVKEDEEFRKNVRPFEY